MPEIKACMSVLTGSVEGTSLPREATEKRKKPDQEPSDIIPPPEPSPGHRTVLFTAG